MKSKFTLTFFLTFCIHTIAIAQQPLFQWVNPLGDVASSYIFDLKLDANNDVFIVGYFSDTLDFDPSPNVFNLNGAGSDNGFIAKYDEQGNFLWAKEVGNASEERILAFDIDTSGNIYTMGYFKNTTDLDPGANVAAFTSNGGRDIFIQKLDANGDFIWAKTLGASGGEEPNDIVVMANGDIVCTGTYEGTVDFDPNAGVQNLSMVGLVDAFILRLDSNGNYVWAKSVGGNAFDQIESLAIDSAQNIYAGGKFRNTVDFDPGTATFNLTSNGNYDAFVLKLNTNGDFVWAKSFGSSNWEDCTAIEVDNLGNVVATGAFYFTVDFDPNAGNFSLTSAQNKDIYILKLDTNGDFVWAKQVAGATGDDYATAIDIDTQNDIYVTGVFWQSADFDPSSAVLTLNAVGGWDAFILKLDELGSLDWVKTFGGVSTDGGNDIAIDNNGAIYTSGDFIGTVDFDPNAGVTNVTSTNNWFDSFVLKLAPPKDNDLGVQTFQTANCSGSFALPVTLKNHGGNTVDTAQIQWTINGILQPVYNFGNTLISDSTTLIFLDTFNFQAPQSYEIKVWTTQPNNVIDPQNFNDTTTISFVPNPVYQIVQNLTICNGEAIMVGNTTHNTTGIFADTLNTIAGCDSIIMTNLLVNPTYSDTILTTICSNQTYNFHGNTLNNSGIYIDTLYSFNGCDSIITLNLTVNPTLSTNLNISICSNQTYNFNGNILSNSGTYLDTLSTVNGCDSTISLQLTINPTQTNILNETICNNQTYTAANIVHDTTGTYIYNLQTWQGCDSILTLNLTVLPISTFNIDTSICSGETFAGYNTTGVYTDIFTAFNGCDSSRIINLTVFPLPNPTITLVNTLTLESNLAVNYQWFFNGMVLTDSTNQRITPSQSGDYSVAIIDNNGCSAVSNTFNFTVVNTNSIHNKTQINILPNPNKGFFNLEIRDLPFGKWQVEIYNINGQIVQISNIILSNSATYLPIQLNDATSGIYWLKMTNDKMEQFSRKFLVQ
jgi:hypothetical protein